MKYLKRLSLALFLILGCRDTDPDLITGKSDKLYLGDIGSIELDDVIIHYRLEIERADPGFYPPDHGKTALVQIYVQIHVQNTQSTLIKAHIIIRTDPATSRVPLRGAVLEIPPYSTAVVFEDLPKNYQYIIIEYQIIKLAGYSTPYYTH